MDFQADLTACHAFNAYGYISDLWPFESLVSFKSLVYHTLHWWEQNSKASFFEAGRNGFGWRLNFESVKLTLFALLMLNRKVSGFKLVRKLAIAVCDKILLFQRVLRAITSKVEKFWSFKLSLRQSSSGPIMRSQVPSSELGCWFSGKWIFPTFQPILVNG